MTAELLSIQFGAGKLFQVLASTDGEDRSWQVPVIYEGHTNSVLLIVDDTPTELRPGTATVSGTGSTVAVGIDYGGAPFVKIGASPWGQASGSEDGYPVKSIVLSDTEFAFNLTNTQFAVPVDLQINLDDSAAPGAVVQLMVDDGDYANVPSGLSSLTATGRTIGLWVRLPDPAARIALTLQHDAPTTYWELAPTDDVLAAGTVGPSPAALLASRSDRSPQLVGLLRYDQDRRGLTPSWVAAHNPLPGGWVANDRDLYLAAGDLDGDGSAEILVRSVDLTVGGRVGVLRHDPQTGGLATVWTGKDVLPGGWPVDVRDAWYPVGDLDGTGGRWLLVRNLPNALDMRSRIGLARFRGGGLEVACTAAGTLPGGWPVSTVCSYLGSDADGYLGIGDIDGDRAAEILTWTRSDAEDRRLAVLAYRGTQLVAVWTCRGEIPGGWALDPADDFISVGAGWGGGHGPVALVRRGAGDLPAALGLVTFGPATRAASLAWSVTGTVDGGWALAPDDVLIPVGDIDGDGQEEILVRGQRPDGTPSAAILRPVDGRGVRATAVTTGTLGTWALDPADVVVPLGDIDGDRHPEILIRSRPQDGSGELALLRYSATTGSLAVSWRAGGAIPGPFS